MTGYELSPHAIQDLAEILAYSDEHFGPDFTDALESRLVAAFRRLALNSGLGHRRSDLTTLPYHFHAVDPHLIVFDSQTEPLPILAIFHASRNIRKLLKARFRKSGVRR